MYYQHKGMLLCVIRPVPASEGELMTSRSLITPVHDALTAGQLEKNRFEVSKFFSCRVHPLDS